MRGRIDPPAVSGVSLAAGLPPSFFGSNFTRQLVEALDEVLTPLLVTLDDLDAYFDARYAPDDYLVWLGGWLSALVDARWSADRVRRHLPDLVESLVSRGTVRGIVAGVRACTGQEPTIRDNGGVAWSSRPNGPLPGSASLLLEVTVPVDGDGESVQNLVRAVVADLKPAHVPVRIRFTGPQG